ncbi:helix-turn-helix domain-containing protein [Paenibacillus lautus]|uniref:helix-turn-helix domain-containing protein n=1 Tax=Paenibacillus lautus TaxID=1401 RepID=UPI00384ECE19
MEIEGAFGLVLKERRQAVGLSQLELANRSGLDRTFISMLERGQRRPTLNTIFSLAKELGVSPSGFVKEVEKYIAKNE